jgi:hypothetical protein
MKKKVKRSWLNKIVKNVFDQAVYYQRFVSKSREPVMKRVSDIREAERVIKMLIRDHCPTIFEYYTKEDLQLASKDDE